MYNIQSPCELKKAIRVIRANLQDRTIVESSYWPVSEVRTICKAFDEIDESGSYDDVIQYYFECPQCKQIFYFYCETYHGGDGAWKPID
jgi:hypothetical protein